MHSPENLEYFKICGRNAEATQIPAFFITEGLQVFARLLESQPGNFIVFLLTLELFELQSKGLENKSCSVAIAEKSWIEATTMQKLNQASSRHLPEFRNHSICFLYNDSSILYRCIGWPGSCSECRHNLSHLSGICSRCSDHHFCSSLFLASSQGFPGKDPSSFFI